MMMRIKKCCACFLFSTLYTFSLLAQNPGTDKIRLNQIGYYPSGPKLAIIVDPHAAWFALIHTTTKDTAFRGNLSKSSVWEHSLDTVKKADFTAFSKPGEYVLYVPQVGVSHPFSISEKVLLPPAKAALKAFYLIRASTDIDEKYAGKWARKAGHPDNNVIIHPSAASASRKDGSTISSPRGWYDAGDYNKYIVNSSITVYTLMAMYEQYPEFFDTLKTNIPESNNKVPDLIDEVLWNLRWMLSMQDQDGGVYHKLTNPNFDAVFMPEAGKDPRYVVQKSTAAALDLAAVAAQAARILKKFNTQLPGLSDSCLKASVNAYNWAKKNPKVYYIQKDLNSKYDPDITTGEYGDQNLKDELEWAGIELFITTGKNTYVSDLQIADKKFDIPNWKEVNMLALYSLLGQKSTPGNENLIKIARDKVIKTANALKESKQRSAFGVPMGMVVKDFEWGSNSVAANQGILLLQAYSLTKDTSYLNAAIANADYLLGRNATSYSFLTGYGEKAINHPHHRPSEADNIPEAVPGLLSGGPNPDLQDAKDCNYKYQKRQPANTFIDDHCSYASNEIAINWNAPAAYLLLGIEAAKAKEKNK